MTDIKSTSVRKYKGQKWRFLFRENGYVIVQVISTTPNKKSEIRWISQLHGTNLESCLQYIWTANGSKGDKILYDDLEIVD